MADTFSHLSTINLEQLRAAELRRRFDHKFILPASRLFEFFEQVPDKYSLLKVEKSCQVRYSTSYFDTEDYRFYNQHHNGYLHRHKVRVRQYQFDNSQYLEVKSKTGESELSKVRMRLQDADSLESEDLSKHLHSLTGVTRNELSRSADITYTRTTLLHTRSGEKVTIDTDVCFSHRDVSGNLAGVAIIERKTEKRNISSPIVLLLKQMRVYPQSLLSKYCLALVICNAPVKYNRFKERVNYISHLAH